MRALGRHGHVRQPGVDRLALSIEAFELGALAGERPVAALTPRPRHVEADVEPYDQMLGQGGPDALVANRATAQRQHLRACRCEELERHLLLHRAEFRLAVLGEHPVDRLAEPILDHAVDVDGGRAERPRGALGRGRLAGAHEPDADDFPLSGRVCFG